MPVIINFKICDNAKECDGVAVCPTGALVWDEKNKTVKINNKKCISCGKCERACMVSAIHVAKTKKEYKKMKEKVKNDSRKSSDLYIDRYGAQPIHPAFLISEDKFEMQVLKASKTAIVELYKNDTVKCLLKSIPIKELFKDLDIKFRKIEFKDDKIFRKYSIKRLPALLFFKKGKLIGKIEGYFENKNKKEIKEKIDKILNLSYENRH